MTREEAIKVLNDYDINFERNTPEEVAEAHEMAIRVLDEQPNKHTEERTETRACDCISREDIGLTNLEILMCNGDYKEALKMLLDKIAKAPSVTPQQKTGHWLSQSEYCKMNNLIPSGLGRYFWCSECNCGIDYKYFRLADYNYCPKCGAKMQEVQK